MPTKVPSVVVDDLWEEFRVGTARPSSVKELLLAGGIRRKKSIWALRGVSFSVGQGETVGLIGPNGSGKSTLLRCLAGILPPSQGSVAIGGSVASLIEVGIELTKELSGRENLEFAAPLFGMSRRELARRIPEIVAFAELEEVIDQPARSYSSGMRMRLSFSLAIHSEPEILLIDEALAVGDESFQRKCAQRVVSLGKSGRTILFVSHDLGLVEQVCRRVILLNAGQVAADGRASEVIGGYVRSSASSTAGSDPPPR